MNAPIDYYGEIIAIDTNGLEIVMHEKYGADRRETGTVVWWDKEKATWTITHRDKPPSYFPKENYSLEFIKKEK